MLAAPKRFVVVLSLALAGWVLAPPLATASTSLGQVGSGPLCGGSDYSEIGYSVASGPSYVVPAGGGVITSWSAQGDADTDDVFKLRIFHPTSPGAHEYVVVAESAQRAIAPDVVNTFPTRTSVQAGDIIGLNVVAGTHPNCELAGVDGDVEDEINPDDGAVGDTEPATSSFTMFKPSVAAKLEPDADGDGYGDETQDQCGTDPTTQAQCQADLSVTNLASAAQATIGDNVTYTIAVKNNSPYNTAKAVVVSDAVPAGMTFVSASGGSCNAATCAIGDLAKGAAATATVIARAKSTGAQTSTASASSQTPDPNAANNSAAATTMVVPAFQLSPLHSRTVRPDRRGRVRLALECPATALGKCVGTDTLRTAGKVTVARRKVLTLGTTRFSIPAGKSHKVTIKLSKAALRLLSRKGTIKARQLVRAHDSRGKPAVKTGKVTIKKR